MVGRHMESDHTHLSIAVRPSPETNDHEVRLLGRDSEDLIARFKEGMIGLDPDGILANPSVLAAQNTPHPATIGRCDCGIIGCGSVEVSIYRTGELVVWQGIGTSTEVRFHAPQYDAEAEKALNDTSWETPDRTAARLISTGIQRDGLRECGFRYSWASGRIRDGKMTVALWLERGPFQVLVHAPWNGRTPEAIATACLEALGRPPEQWEDVDWFPQSPDLISGPGHAAPPKHEPDCAGPGWRLGTS